MLRVIIRLSFVWVFATHGVGCSEDVIRQESLVSRSAASQQSRS